MSSRLERDRHAGIVITCNPDLPGSRVEIVGAHVVPGQRQQSGRCTGSALSAQASAIYNKPSRYIPYRSQKGPGTQYLRISKDSGPKSLPPALFLRPKSLNKGYLDPLGILWYWDPFSQLWDPFHPGPRKHTKQRPEPLREPKRPFTHCCRPGCSSSFRIQKMSSFGVQGIQLIPL